MNNKPKLSIKKDAAAKIGMDKSIKEKRREIQAARRKEFEEREAVRREEMRVKHERDTKNKKKRDAIEADYLLETALMRYEDADVKALKNAEEQLVNIKARAETLWLRLEEEQVAQIDAEMRMEELQRTVDTVLPALEQALAAAEAAWALTDKAFRKNPKNRDRNLKKSVKEILG